jgi:multidrug resistance efflux pump
MISQKRHREREAAGSGRGCSAPTSNNAPVKPSSSKKLAANWEPTVGRPPGLPRRLGSRVRSLLAPLAIVVLVVAALWWRAQPPRVTVALSERRDVVTSIVTTGQVETVRVSPGSETGGRIERLLAHRGQEIAEGELLAVLDTRELAAREREAEASLAAARLKAAAAAPRRGALRSSRRKRRLPRRGCGRRRQRRNGKTCGPWPRAAR